MLENKYKIHENETVDGFYIVELLEDPYAGVKYYYMGTQLEEGEGQAVLRFHYEIVEGNELVNEDFKTYIGDILVELIELSMETKSLTYARGTD